MVSQNGRGCSKLTCDGNCLVNRVTKYVKRHGEGLAPRPIPTGPIGGYKDWQEELKELFLCFGGSWDWKETDLRHEPAELDVDFDVGDE